MTDLPPLAWASVARSVEQNVGRAMFQPDGFPRFETTAPAPPAPVAILGRCPALAGILYGYTRGLA